MNASSFSPRWRRGYFSQARLCARAVHQQTANEGVISRVCLARQVLVVLKPVQASSNVRGNRNHDAVIARRAVAAIDRRLHLVNPFCLVSKQLGSSAQAQHPHRERFVAMLTPKLFDDSAVTGPREVRAQTLADVQAASNVGVSRHRASKKVDTRKLGKQLEPIVSYSRVFEGFGLPLRFRRYSEIARSTRRLIGIVTSASAVAMTRSASMLLLLSVRLTCSFGFSVFRAAIGSHDTRASIFCHSNSPKSLDRIYPMIRINPSQVTSDSRVCSPARGFEREAA